MSKNITVAAIWVTLVTFLSKITGFIREIIFAAHYGVSLNSDSYIMAHSIVGIFVTIILAALGTTFIPVMSDYIQQKNRDETNKFINVVYSFVTVFSIVFCIIGLVFTKQLVFMFAPNFPPEAQTLTVELTRILIPLIVITAIVTLNNARLQNHGSFLIPAGIAIPQNFLVILVMLFFTGQYGIQGLTVAFVIGAVLQIAIQLPQNKKLGYRFKLNFDLKDEGLRRIGVLIVPIMIGSGIQQINIMIDRMLASGLPEGSVAALNFSTRLSLFVIGLLSAAVVSVFYTSISHYFTAGNDQAFKKLLRNTINISVLLVLPATVCFVVLRMPIIELIFQRGLFDSTASEMTAIALFYYTFGLIGFLLRDVISRAFYALKDTKTAMINGSIAVGLNIVLSIILVRYMGLGGLALGTSISGLIGTILLMMSLYRKIGDYGMRNIIITFIKVLMTSILLGILLKGVYDWFFNWTASNTLSLIISVGCGGLMYIVVTMLLKIEEFNILQQLIRNRIFKKDKQKVSHKNP